MNRSFARVIAWGTLVICPVLLAVSAVDADAIFGNGIPNILYDQVTGQLSVVSDGADISSVLVEGPMALSIDRWLDGTFQDGAEWSQAYLNDRQQWIVTGAFGTGGTGAEFVPQGTYQIATYDVNSVSLLDFATVEMAIQNPQDTLTTTVDAFLSGDFDGSGLVEQADLDLVLIHWGVSTPPAPEGWVNDLPEESIDQDEIDRVLLNWGNGAPVTVSVSVVPEPLASGLVITPFFFFFRGLRRRILIVKYGG